MGLGGCGLGCGGLLGVWGRDGIGFVVCFLVGQGQGCWSNAIGVYDRAVAGCRENAKRVTQKGNGKGPHLKLTSEI